MAILEFPPIDSADEHGLLALGGDLETDSLLLAYSLGIFPWPISDEYSLAWFSPDPRGILFFDKLHLSKSFRKFLKKNPYDVRFNTNFAAVIKHCAEVKRQDQPSTWITQEIIDAYIKLQELGFAYSIETYLDDRLVGGVYGVCINRFYSGESMFHLEDNASKVALVSLMYLLKQRDIGWIDTQMVTPVVQSLGGVDIPRETYLKILQVSLKSQ